MLNDLLKSFGAWVFLALVLSVIGTDALAQMGEEPIEIEGVVERFVWTNPSAYVDVAVEVPDGEGANIWTVWIRSPADWASSGWSSTSLVPGDRIKVTGPIVRDIERRELLANALSKADGPNLLPRVADPMPVPDRTELSAAAALAGSWLPLGALPSHLIIGVDPFQPDHLLNDAGKARLTESETLELTEADVAVSDLARCVPLSPPTSMTVMGIKGFEMRGEDIVIRETSVGDVERVIHMTETTPEANVSDRQGYSVGRWDDDVLFVETVFDADVVDRIAGVPLNSSARLVERFELTGDRTMLKYSFSVESPDYLVLPFTPRSNGWAWIFQPDVDVPRIECDPEIARRFERAAQQDRPRLPQIVLQGQYN